MFHEANTVENETPGIVTPTFLISVASIVSTPVRSKNSSLSKTLLTQSSQAGTACVRGLGRTYRQVKYKQHHLSE
jgi:hypothetical protein